jgi:hypothetical protein
LRALVVCLFTLVLVVQVAAAATKAESARAEKSSLRAAAKEQKALTLEQRLERSRSAARKHRGTIRFYENRPNLLTSGEHRAEAVANLREAKRGLAKAEKMIAKLRKAIAKRDATRRASLRPRAAICDVFGKYCEQAVDVAWCESRLQTTARNGQYLGLFQMGYSERRRFGHGPTAHQQAVAAHKYFVLSGRDWSPWGCRWAAF